MESKSLTAYNERLKAIEEDAKFYISTPERAAEALLFVRGLEKFCENIKEKVKERAVKVMDKENKELVSYSITDPETGEVREWELRRDYGTQTKEYRPENLFKILGEKSFKYFKVGKVAVEKDLAKMSAKGEMSMQEVTDALSDPVIKMRKGCGVKIREVKAK